MKISWKLILKNGGCSHWQNRPSHIIWINLVKTGYVIVKRWAYVKVASLAILVTSLITAGRGTWTKTGLQKPTKPTKIIHQFANPVIETGEIQVVKFQILWDSSESFAPLCPALPRSLSIKLLLMISIIHLIPFQRLAQSL